MSEDVELPEEQSGGGGGGGSGGSSASSGASPAKEKSQGGGGADDGPDPDAWMVTFSDLLTLLMTFFVLIFASQDPVKEKFYEAFGQSQGVFGKFRTTFFEPLAVVKRQDINQDRLQVFLDEIGSLDIRVNQEDRGLVITLPSHAFFREGIAELNASGLKRVTQLASLLRYTKHNIRVEGHADRDETSLAYRDHWDLSLARARTVLLQLERGKVPSRSLSVVGYGSTKPRFGSRSRSSRAKNRRVEIVIANRGEKP